MLPAILVSLSLALVGASARIRIGVLCSDARPPTSTYELPLYYPDSTTLEFKINDTVVVLDIPSCVFVSAGGLSLALEAPLQRAGIWAAIASAEGAMDQIVTAAGRAAGRALVRTRNAMNEGMRPVFSHSNATFTRTGPGFHMWTLDQNKCIFISRAIQEVGVWEERKSWGILRALAAAKKTAETAGVFLDVGAHAGWFSLLAAWYGHRVVSIEAMDENMELLRANIATNVLARIKRHGPLPGRIDIHHAAVAAAAGIPICMVPNEGTAGANSGNGQMHQLPNCTSSARLTTTLDKLLARAAEPIAVAKFDIEGAETVALEGFSATLSDPLRKPCLLFVEFGFTDVGLAQGQSVSLFSFLEQNGYIAYVSPPEAGPDNRQPDAWVPVHGPSPEGKDYEFHVSPGGELLSQRCGALLKARRRAVGERPPFMLQLPTVFPRHQGGSIPLRWNSTRMEDMRQAISLHFSVLGLKEDETKVRDLLRVMRLRTQGWDEIPLRYAVETDGN